MKVTHGPTNGRKKMLCLIQDNGTKPWKRAKCTNSSEVFSGKGALIVHIGVNQGHSVQCALYI